MAKILVGLSGGIDSCVAAYKLKTQGHDVQAVTMTVWKKSWPFKGVQGKDACFSPDREETIDRCRQFCRQMEIPYHVLDISDLYESVVLKNFRDEYLNGRTPNPCIWCNQKIKFGAMVSYAREQGIQFEKFATGHYARIVFENGRYCLYRGKDPVKDQSYFLYRLSQEQLSSTLFPLGDYLKSEIRQIDNALGFHPEGQSESQDFYGGHYSDLLDVSPKEGLIVDCDGKVLGKHNGMWNYTIGQRKGLGVSAPKPLYVISLRPETNEVVVGYEDRTNNTQVTANQLNWVSVDHLEGPVHAHAKIRSTGYAVPCTVSCEADGHLKAVFDVPVKAATCGQSLVVFDGDRILCGGIIDSTL